MFVSHNPATIASIGAPLSWGLEAGQPKRMVYVSGQVGADSNGRVAEGFLAQAKLTWENVGAVLRSAGMTSANVARTGIFITPSVVMTPETKAAFNKLRTDFLGENRPASTMICVHALMDPAWLIEIDAVAIEL
ncbi:MAG: RidA family protein [Rhodospirillales bacterium]|nr:RidA family protein [Rhodospirillales bacterium]